MQVNFASSGIIPAHGFGIDPYIFGSADRASRHAEVPDGNEIIGIPRYLRGGVWRFAVLCLPELVEISKIITPPAEVRHGIGLYVDVAGCCRSNGPGCQVEISLFPVDGTRGNLQVVVFHVIDIESAVGVFPVFKISRIR